MRSLVVAGLFLTAMLPGPALAERVSVREGILRATPAPLGAIKGKIPYDTEVRVERTQDAWVLISQPDSGWLHASSLGGSPSSGALVPGKAGRGASVSANEVSLAGKGFDRNVEAAYRQTHGALRYDLIDRVERVTVAEEEVRQFVAAGTRRGQ